MASRARRATALAALTSTMLAVANPAPAAGTEADTTPPTVPGTPVATQVTETSALLTWRPSTDDTAVTQYEIWYQRPGDTGFHSSSAVPSYRLTGLRPDTTYTWVVRASDGRNLSGFSAPVTFRTDPAPSDAEPPSPPGAPQVAVVTADTVELSWAASTDNASEPTYLVYARPEGVGAATVVGAATGTVTRVTMLIPDLTYDFHVVARDVSGNVSAPSPSIRQRTGADPDASCRAGYQPAGGGTPGLLQVTNTGPVGLSAWSIRFRLPDDTRIEAAGYAWAQHGADVVLWWSGWGDELSVGETLSAPLRFPGGTPDVVPTAVTLNGVACATT